MSAPAIGQWEQRLEREGLAALDYEGERKVDDRGSGSVKTATRAFLREMAAEEVEARSALRNRRYKRGERRIVEMYALGMSTRVIARRTGRGRMAVYRLIRRVKARRPPEQRLGQLLAACEPTTIVLVFALLERALSAPTAIRAAIAAARAIPEIRALLEEELCRPISRGKGHRRHGHPLGAHGEVDESDGCQPIAKVFKQGHG